MMIPAYTSIHGIHILSPFQFNPGSDKKVVASNIGLGALDHEGRQLVFGFTGQGMSLHGIKKE